MRRLHSGLRGDSADTDDADKRADVDLLGRAGRRLPFSDRTLYGLFSKKITRASVWASFAVGTGITVVNFFFPFVQGAASATVGGAIAILSSFVVCLLVSLFTSKMDRAYVDRAFSCYDEPVTAESKEVLTEE